MRDLPLNELRDEIKQLQHSTIYEYADALPPELKVAQYLHNEFVLNKLLTILTPLSSAEEAIDIESIKSNLRVFLYSLWGLFANSSFDYTHHPRLPSNIACVRLAHWVAKEEEAICHILMPTVQGVEGGVFSNLKENAEEDSKFDPSHFVINERGDKLIDIATVFKFASQDTNNLFPPLGSESRLLQIHPTRFIKSTFDLSEKERDLLRHSVGEVSETYYYLLKCKHETPSVGSALRELMWVLYQSSKMERGVEEEADLSECAPAILHFYQIWCALTEPTQRSLQALRVEGVTFTLGNYLLRLFITIENEAELERRCHSLTEPATQAFSCLTFEEIGRIGHTEIAETRLWLIHRPDWFKYVERIIPCAHLISQQLAALINPLDGFLLDDLNPFKMPLPAEFGGVDLLNPPTQERFIELDNQLIETLSQRKPMLGCEDYAYLRRRKFFEMIVGDMNRRPPFENLVNRIDQAVSLADALLMIPPGNWGDFRVYFTGPRLKKIFIDHLNDHEITTASVFLSLLKQIPEIFWKNLFEVFCFPELELFKAEDLGWLLCSLPEHQWNTLIQSVDMVLNVILVTGKQLALFFMPFVLRAPGFVPEHCNQIFNLLKNRIESIFKDPTQLAAFLNHQPLMHGIDLLISFDADAWEHYFDHIEKIYQVTSYLDLHKRFYFLECLGFEHLSGKILSAEALGKILTVLDYRKVSDVLSKLEEGKIKQLIATKDQLRQFLLSFLEKDRMVFLRKIHTFVPMASLIATPTDLFQLLNLLPSHTWQEVFKTIGNDSLSQYIGDCASLVNFLKQFKDVMDGVSCVMALSQFIASQVKTGDECLQLLQALPAYWNPLTQAVKPKLSSFILNMLESVKQYALDDTSTSLCFSRCNDFLKIVLPVVLSLENLESLWAASLTWRRGWRSPFAGQVILRIREIEQSQLINEWSDFQVALKKLTMLTEFMACPVYSHFRNELRAYFGDSFFQELSQYIKSHPDITPASVDVPVSALIAQVNTALTPVFFPRLGAMTYPPRTTDHILPGAAWPGLFGASPGAFGPPPRTLSPGWAWRDGNAPAAQP